MVDWWAGGKPQIDPPFTGVKIPAVDGDGNGGVIDGADLGGGLSFSTATAGVVGVVNDWEPPNAALVGITHSQAAAWQPLTVYVAGSVVIPTVPNGFGYTAAIIALSGLSGPTEPNWPASNATVADNELLWHFEPEGLADGDGVWHPETAYAAFRLIKVTVGSDVVVAITDAGGTTGTDEPDWQDLIDVGSIIGDGDVQWDVVGIDLGPWQADHLYDFADLPDPGFGGDFNLCVEPSTPDGRVFTLSIAEATSSADEPDWPTSAGTVDDDGLRWTFGSEGGSGEIRSIASVVDGRELLLVNIGGSTLDCTDSRLLDGPIHLAEDGWLHIVYSAAIDRWIILGFAEGTD